MGIIVKDGAKTEEEVKSLVFLSITIESAEKGFNLHQKVYLRDKLTQRCVVYGKPGLPEIREGTRMPVSEEMRGTGEYKKALHHAQQ